MNKRKKCIGRARRQKGGHKKEDGKLEDEEREKQRKKEELKGYRLC